MGTWLRTRALLVLFVIAAVPAARQSLYPQPTEIHVNDFAGLLSAPTADLLRALLAEVRTETGTEIVIVTIRSYAPYNTGAESFEAFATGLFNDWGIGSVQSHDGVLLLAAVDDRQVRIEVGSSYENTLDAALAGIISEHILPAFRERDYEGGIYQGTRAIVHALTGEFPPDQRPEGAPPRPVFVPPERAQERSGSLEAVFWLALIVVGAGAFIYRMATAVENWDGSSYDDDSSWDDGNSSSGWRSSGRRSSSSSSGSRGSSSSGSRRHGGGRSSGGGASGKW